jgi:hypothetical protein
MSSYYDDAWEQEMGYSSHDDCDDWEQEEVEQKPIVKLATSVLETVKEKTSVSMQVMKRVATPVAPSKKPKSIAETLKKMKAKKQTKYEHKEATHVVRDTVPLVKDAVPVVKDAVLVKKVKKEVMVPMIRDFREFSEHCVKPIEYLYRDYPWDKWLANEGHENKFPHQIEYESIITSEETKNGHSIDMEGGAGRGKTTGTLGSMINYWPKDSKLVIVSGATSKELLAQQLEYISEVSSKSEHSIPLKIYNFGETRYGYYRRKEGKESIVPFNAERAILENDVIVCRPDESWDDLVGHLIRCYPDDKFPFIRVLFDEYSNYFNAGQFQKWNSERESNLISSLMEPLCDLVFHSKGMMNLAFLSAQALLPPKGKTTMTCSQMLHKILDYYGENIIRDDRVRGTHQVKNIYKIMHPISILADGKTAHRQIIVYHINKEGASHPQVGGIDVYVNHRTGIREERPKIYEAQEKLCEMHSLDKPNKRQAGQPIPLPTRRMMYVIRKQQLEVFEEHLTQACLLYGDTFLWTREISQFQKPGSVFNILLVEEGKWWFQGVTFTNLAAIYLCSLTDANYALEVINRLGGARSQGAGWVFLFLNAVGSKRSTKEEYESTTVFNELRRSNSSPIREIDFSGPDDYAFNLFPTLEPTTFREISVQEQEEMRKILVGGFVPYKDPVKFKLHKWNSPDVQTLPKTQETGEVAVEEDSKLSYFDMLEESVKQSEPNMATILLAEIPICKFWKDQKCTNKTEAHREKYRHYFVSEAEKDPKAKICEFWDGHSCKHDSTNRGVGQCRFLHTKGVSTKVEKSEVKEIVDTKESSPKSVPNAWGTVEKPASIFSKATVEKEEKDAKSAPSYLDELFTTISSKPVEKQYSNFKRNRLPKDETPCRYISKGEKCPHKRCDYKH